MKRQAIGHNDGIACADNETIQRNPCRRSQIVLVLELIRLACNRRPGKDELISVQEQHCLTGAATTRQCPIDKDKGVIGRTQCPGTDRDRIVPGGLLVVALVLKLGAPIQHIRPFTEQNHYNWRSMTNSAIHRFCFFRQR